MRLYAFLLLISAKVSCLLPRQEVTKRTTTLRLHSSPRYRVLVCDSMIPSFQISSLSIDTIQHYGYETNHMIPCISIENLSSIIVRASKIRFIGSVTKYLVRVHKWSGRTIYVRHNWSGRTIYVVISGPVKT